MPTTMYHIHGDLVAHADLTIHIRQIDVNDTSHTPYNIAVSWRRFLISEKIDTSRRAVSDKNQLIALLKPVLHCHDIMLPTRCIKI